MFYSLRLKVISLFGVSLLSLISCSDDNNPNESKPQVAAPAVVREAPAPVNVSAAPAAKVDQRAVRSIEKARDGTVAISTGWSKGSGFFVDKNCLVVTNRHVVIQDAEDVETLQESIKNTDEAILNIKREIRDKVSRYYNYEGSSHHKAMLEKIATLKNLHAELESKNEIVTNYRRMPSVEIKTLDGTTYNSWQIKESENHDLAFISIHNDKCSYFGENRSPDLTIGRRTYAVGSPIGLEFSLSSGVLSATRNFGSSTLLQTDAPINPGNSGGPLLDEKGRLLGVNTAHVEGMDGIGFAIPIDVVYAEIKNLGLSVSANEAAETAAKPAASAGIDYDRLRRLAEEKQESVTVDRDEIKRLCQSQFDEDKYADALKTCRQSAAGGDGNANLLVGKLLLGGKLGYQDKQGAAAAMEHAANADVVEAQQILGQMYRYGIGVQVDGQKTLFWLNKAAEKQNAEALNLLGILHESGIFVPRDVTKAFQYLKSAQEKGSLSAIHNMASIYQRGEVVPADPVKSFELYKMAAEKGFAASQLQLAYCFYKKVGTEKDYVKSYAWLTVAEVNQDGKDILGWDSQLAFEMRKFMSGIMSSNQIQQANALSKQYIEKYKSSQKLIL